MAEENNKHFKTAEQKHKENVILKCKVCGQKMQGKSTLSRHISHAHDEMDPADREKLVIDAYYGKDVVDRTIRKFKNGEYKDKALPIDIGKYLRILSTNGVNQIEGISVSYSRYEEAYCEALGKAMAQARTKAETMAAMEDATVTGHFTVTEGYQDDSLRGMSKSFAGNYSMSEYEEAAMDVAGGFEYSVGPTEVKATVTVCYMIDTRLE